MASAPSSDSDIAGDAASDELTKKAAAQKGRMKNSQSGPTAALNTELTCWLCEEAILSSDSPKKLLGCYFHGDAGACFSAVR